MTEFKGEIEGIPVSISFEKDIRLLTIVIDKDIYRFNNVHSYRVDSYGNTYDFSDRGIDMYSSPEKVFSFVNKSVKNKVAQREHELLVEKQEKERERLKELERMEFEKEGNDLDKMWELEFNKLKKCYPHRENNCKSEGRMCAII